MFRPLRLVTVFQNAPQPWASSAAFFFSNLGEAHHETVRPVASHLVRKNMEEIPTFSSKRSGNSVSAIFKREKKTVVV